MESLAFRIKNLYYAFAEAIGLANFSGDTLMLEFRIRDSLLGLIKSGIKEYKFHIKDLESLTFQKNLFSSRLLIKARKMETFVNFPGSQQGEIPLQIKRKDRELAEQFSAHLNWRISEYQLKQIDNLEE